MAQHIASSHRKNWYIVYSVLLGAILLLAISKEIFNLTVLSDKRVRFCWHVILKCYRSGYVETPWALWCSW